MVRQLLFLTAFVLFTLGGFAQIPKEFVGTWYGNLHHQKDQEPEGQVRIIIKDGKKGEVIASIYYINRDSGGNLELLEVKSSPKKKSQFSRSLLLQEDLTYGPDQRYDEGILRLGYHPKSGNYVLQWDHPGFPKRNLIAVMKKG